MINEYYINVVRCYNTPDGQGLVGKLYINDKFFCHTLENRDFIIPIGKYKITLDVQSPKYCTREPYKSLCIRNGVHGCVPRILNVIGRSGILIHCGNYAKDSMGCILVGQYDKFSKNRIIESKRTFIDLYHIIRNSKLLIELEIHDVRNIESIKNIK